MLIRFSKLPLLLLLLPQSLVQLPVLGQQLRPEPQVHSLFPLGGQRGTSFETELRGACLENAYAVWFDGDDLEARIQRIEPIVGEEEEQKKYSESKTCAEEQRIVAEVAIDQVARTGPRFLRVISPRGVSNSVLFLVNSDAVTAESRQAHGTPDGSQRITVPTVINGKIDQLTERDYYELSVSKGDEVAFEIFASGRRGPPVTGEGRTSLEGIPKMRWLYRFAQGGRYLLRVESLRVVELVLPATVVSFVPRLTLHETAGSWLNPTSPKQLMFEDDGSPDFASQVAKTIYARTLPDFGYQLRIVPASWPGIYEGWSRQLARFEWRERDFRRKLESNRLQLLRARTVEPPTGARAQRGDSSPGPLSHAATDAAKAAGVSRVVPGVIESYVEEEPNGIADEALEISLPALVEGAVEGPGDADIYKFKVRGGQPVAFEVETPGILPPQFYPMIEVQDATGFELLSNAHRKLSIDVTDPLPYVSILECLGKGAGCDLHSISYLEALEAKVTHTFEQEGEYYLTIRNLIPREADPRHVYHLLIRPQIPHVGEIELKQDHINLVAGQAGKLTLVTEREEGFEGEIAISVEGLPEGVSAFTGTELEEKKHPGDASVRKESFLPKTQKATIILMAAEDAPSTVLPKMIRLRARPVVTGNPGQLLPIGEIPLMVIRSTQTQPKRVAEK